MQLALDELYAASVKGQRFCNLVELIKRPENIKLAYRNIRKNSGSRTAGVDNKTISDLNKWNENALVAHVQRKLDWYVPNAVRRVEIPKDNGKTRPLGIPTIMDRLIQQCILQVLEPVFISDEAAQRHLQCGSLLPQLKLKFQTPLRDGEQHSSSQRCVRQSSATEVFPTHEA